MIQRLGRLLGLLATAALMGCSAEQVHYESLPTPPGSVQSVVATVYLLGDGGEASPQRDEVLRYLQQDIEATLSGDDPAPVVVAFLGDNIYEEGASPEPTDEDVEKLAGQVRALPVHGDARGVFVPGNHDWAKGAGLEEARAAVVRQREWVRQMAGGRDLSLLPGDGCPGPETEDVGDVHLVFIDSEWLLRAPEGECGSADDFYARLAEDLRANRNRRVVILAHHPLVSGGPHGGNVSPFQRGPLVYYLAVKSGIIRQDIASPAYTAMRRGISEAIEAGGARPLIHAAGHDHNLQIIRMTGDDQPRYQIVSGAAARTERTRRVEGTRYATDGFGYVRLDFTAEDVRVVVHARAVDGGPVRPVFACTVSRAARPDECPEAPIATASP